MRACLQSLSLVHCPWILSNSERGMLACLPNFNHRLSLMMSRTVERFSGVRLGSGNKNRRNRVHGENENLSSCSKFKQPIEESCTAKGKSSADRVLHDFLLYM